MSDGEQRGEASRLVRKPAPAPGSILTWKAEVPSAQSVCYGARTNTDFGKLVARKCCCWRAFRGDSRSVPASC